MRGPARNQQTYYARLNNADLPRRNDLDGRGPLSQEGLVDFGAFFLVVGASLVSTLVPWVAATASAAVSVTHGTSCVVILARFSGVISIQFPRDDSSHRPVTIDPDYPGYLRKWRWISYP